MSSVLLLNAGYEPLAIVTQRRALSLLLRGHVEAACTEALEMHGVTTTLHIPTVIRCAITSMYLDATRTGAERLCFNAMLTPVRIVESDWGT
jgi:hypothetical protein